MGHWKAQCEEKWGGSGEMDITQDQGKSQGVHHHSDKSVCLHVCLSVTMYTLGAVELRRGPQSYRVRSDRRL